MNTNQVAAIFRRNMTALVTDAAQRRQAKPLNAGLSKPSRPIPKQAA